MFWEKKMQSVFDSQDTIIYKRREAHIYNTHLDNSI